MPAASLSLREFPEHLDRGDHVAGDECGVAQGREVRDRPDLVGDRTRRVESLEGGPLALLEQPEIRLDERCRVQDHAAQLRLSGLFSHLTGLRGVSQRVSQAAGEPLQQDKLHHGPFATVLVSALDRRCDELGNHRAGTLHLVRVLQAAEQDERRAVMEDEWRVEAALDRHGLLQEPRRDFERPGLHEPDTAQRHCDYARITGPLGAAETAAGGAQTSSGVSSIQRQIAR